MGKMEGQLCRLLSEVGRISEKSIPIPGRAAICASAHAAAIHQAYRMLGGQHDEFPLNLRTPWDMEFDTVAIELDEVLHFNRYRNQTLDSLIYDELPQFPRQIYRHYCEAHESECMRIGKIGRRWSSPSCETQFGIGSPPGQFANNGSPRWKQRAFYDFIKDAWVVVSGQPMVRIAIWDEIEEGAGRRVVQEALARPSGDTPSALAELIRKRVPA